MSHILQYWSGIKLLQSVTAREAIDSAKIVASELDASLSSKLQHSLTLVMLRSAGNSVGQGGGSYDDYGGSSSGS